MTYNTGTIGDFMRWTQRVAANPQLAADKPKQWFDTDATAVAATSGKLSPEAMVKLLSKDNLALLQLIGSRTFASMRELAETAKRRESNLSRTLKRFQEAGIVALDHGTGRKMTPRLIARRVTLDLDLVGASSTVTVRQPLLATKSA